LCVFALGNGAMLSAFGHAAFTRGARRAGANTQDLVAWQARIASPFQSIRI